MTNVTHLECSLTGERYEAGQVHNLSRAGKPLLVRYDLEAAKRTLTRDSIAAREPGMWKWGELLPHAIEPVSLGEPETPILHLPRTAAQGRRVRADGQGRRAAADRIVQGARPGDGGDHGEAVRDRAHRHADQRQCRRGARRLWRAGRDRDDRHLPRRNARDQCHARPRPTARASMSPTGRSTNAVRWSGRARPRGCGSTARRSRSPTGSRARRRWGSSSPSSSAGSCPTRSSIRPAAAPA